MRIAFALLLTLVLGCMGPTFIVQQYGGPARPRETISILRVNGADSVRLLFLDDEDVAAPVASDGRLHIELLPGKHSLTARNGDERTSPTGSLAFAAEPNKVYRVIFTGDTPHLYEVDRDSDKPGREVTAVSTEPERVKLPPVEPAAPAPTTAPTTTPTE